MNDTIVPASRSDDTIASDSKSNDTVVPVPEIPDSDGAGGRSVEWQGGEGKMWVASVLVVCCISMSM